MGSVDRLDDYGKNEVGKVLRPEAFGQPFGIDVASAGNGKTIFGKHSIRQFLIVRDIFSQGGIRSKIGAFERHGFPGRSHDEKIFFGNDHFDGESEIFRFFLENLGGNRPIGHEVGHNWKN
jgi:hypothetical protein